MVCFHQFQISTFGRKSIRLAASVQSMEVASKKMHALPFPIHSWFFFLSKNLLKQNEKWNKSTYCWQRYIYLTRVWMSSRINVVLPRIYYTNTFWVYFLKIDFCTPQTTICISKVECKNQWLSYFIWVVLAFKVLNWVISYYVNFDFCQDKEVSSSSFTPFGGGQRLCPGLDLARLETSIFLHHFVTRFR